MRADATKVTVLFRGLYRARALFWLAWALYRTRLIDRDRAHAIIKAGLDRARMSVAGSPWMRVAYTAADLDRQLTKGYRE